MKGTRALVDAVALVAILVTTSAAAQAPFAFRTRAVLAGSSDHSEPEHYEVYSSITLEAALTWAFHRCFALEANVRPESHEVDVDDPNGGRALRLGSLELFAFNLLAQWRPFPDGAVHPYLGAGVNVTVPWEKSGALDDARLTTSIGPAVQLGLDVDLSDRVLLDVQVRWNSMRTTMDVPGRVRSHLTLDPLTLGLGLGFRF